MQEPVSVVVPDPLGTPSTAQHKSTIQGVQEPVSVVVSDPLGTPSTAQHKSTIQGVQEPVSVVVSDPLGTPSYNTSHQLWGVRASISGRARPS